MAGDDPWTDPETWGWVTVWFLFALSPLFVFLPCVLHPDVDVNKTSRNQWFYSTEIGAHRIPAEWHTFWLGAACIVTGVAQFLAWREDTASWYYPAAMVSFYVVIALQWAWIAAYFRLVKRFTTGRNCLLLALIANIVLFCLYIPLHKLSAVLFSLRIVLHDLPMFVISVAAVRLHRVDDEYAYRHHHRKKTVRPGASPRDPRNQESDEEGAGSPQEYAQPSSRESSPPRSRSPRPVPSVRASNTIDINEMLGIKVNAV